MQIDHDAMVLVADGRKLLFQDGCEGVQVEERREAKKVEGGELDHD